MMIEGDDCLILTDDGTVIVSLSGITIPAAFLTTKRRGATESAPIPLGAEDMRALAGFCARAVGAEPPLVWRECDPKEVQVGWLVESRSDSCTLRAVVTALAHGQILGGDASSRCLLWGPSVDDWALWTTAPAPNCTTEERALRDLLSDLDPEKLAKVITAAKAAFGGGSK
jgi:hypothetical protein